MGCGGTEPAPRCAVERERCQTPIRRLKVSRKVAIAQARRNRPAGASSSIVTLPARTRVDKTRGIANVIEGMCEYRAYATLSLPSQRGIADHQSCSADGLAVHDSVRDAPVQLGVTVDAMSDHVYAAHLRKPLTCCGQDVSESYLTVLELLVRAGARMRSGRSGRTARCAGTVALHVS